MKKEKLMIALSQRLDKIASFVENGERVADIGTDHGYIPIYLKAAGISDFVIAADVNRGPLEKMKENLDKYLPANRNGIDMRLGSGLEVIESGEVDTVIIAGMGGLLMIDLLEADLSKTRSFRKYIFQPRNAQDKLRKWLIDNDFKIFDEVLAEEGRFVWEIIAAYSPLSDSEMLHSSEEYVSNEYFDAALKQYEVGQFLIKKKDPLLRDFINRKLIIEKKIADDTLNSVGELAAEKRQATLDKIEMLEEILKNVSE